MSQKSKFRAFKCVKMAVWTSNIPENDFTENLSDRKIMKFPHCGMSTNGKMVMMIESRSRECPQAWPKLPALLIIQGDFSIISAPNFLEWFFFSRLMKKLRFSKMSRDQFLLDLKFNSKNLYSFSVIFSRFRTTL